MKIHGCGFQIPYTRIPPVPVHPLPESHQGGAQVPIRPSQVNAPRGDMYLKCREAWRWLVSVLQFWEDKASSTNGKVYGGHECPVSALAEYVLNTINLGLDPGSKVSWDDVVTQTPWLSKRLHGMTAAQEMTVRRQALPVPGESSSLRWCWRGSTPSKSCIPRDGGSWLWRIPPSPVTSLSLHLGCPRLGEGMPSSCT